MKKSYLIAYKSYRCEFLFRMVFLVRIPFVFYNLDNFETEVV